MARASKKFPQTAYVAMKKNPADEVMQGRSLMELKKQ